MSGPYPSPVPTFHNKSYSAIDPIGKASGKVVVITGASGGIGSDIAKSFAKAGAKKIVLLGRDEARLEKVRAVCRENGAPMESVIVHAADMLDEVAMGSVAADVGAWDVLVSSAGAASAPSVIGENLEAWWSVLQTNVKGTLNTVSAFLPHVRTSGPVKPTIINLTAGSILIDPKREPAALSSAYNSSKVAVIKLIEHLAAERSDLVAVNLHPGIIPTATFDLVRSTKPSAEDITRLTRAGYIDEPGLAGDFAVWLSGPEASWLSGKMVWANWDVEEMIERKEHFSQAGWGSLTVQGWPFV